MVRSEPVSVGSLVHRNEELGRAFFTEQDRLRGGPAESLCAPQYRALLGSAPAIDRAGHEAFALAFYGAFGDLHHEIDEVIATEERVTVRFILHGTHTGNFFGIPATQRSIKIAANVIMHVDEGKVTTLKGVFDEAGMLRQLGVLPAG